MTIKISKFSSEIWERTASLQNGSIVEVDAWGPYKYRPGSVVGMVIRDVVHKAILGNIEVILCGCDNHGEIATKVCEDIATQLWQMDPPPTVDSLCVVNGEPLPGQFQKLLTSATIAAETDEVSLHLLKCAADDKPFHRSVISFGLCFGGVMVCFLQFKAYGRFNPQEIASMQEIVRSAVAFLWNLD